jgi:hypothetical protein
VAKVIVCIELRKQKLHVVGRTSTLESLQREDSWSVTTGSIQTQDSSLAEEKGAQTLLTTIVFVVGFVFVFPVLGWNPGPHTC